MAANGAVGLAEAVDGQANAMIDLGVIVTLICPGAQWSGRLGAYSCRHKLTTGIQSGSTGEAFESIKTLLFPPPKETGLRSAVQKRPPPVGLEKERGLAVSRRKYDNFTVFQLDSTTSAVAGRLSRTRTGLL
jgi:hypothetical protein